MQKSQPQKRFTLILIGDPTAGKDTQSKLLAKKYNLHEFSSGQALRELRDKDPSVRKLLQQSMDKGKMATSTVFQKLLLANFPKFPRNKEVLFNGPPRMLGEAKLMRKTLIEFGRALPIIIYLGIPEKEILKRTGKRVAVSDRADDKAVKARIRDHRFHLRRVFDYFKKHYPSAKVSGVGTVEEVNKRLVRNIEELLISPLGTRGGRGSSSLGMSERTKS